MKKYLLPIFLFLFLSSIAAFADTGIPDIQPVSTEDFLHFLTSSFGGAKGAGAMAMAAFVVQAIIRFLKTPIVDSVFLRIGGKWKLTIVTGLTIVSGVIGLLLSGVPLAAALLHATTLSALLVFGNQLYRQFTEREPNHLAPGDPASPPSPMTVTKSDEPKAV